MAFKMSLTDQWGNAYPNAVGIVKYAGFDDFTPAARCVIRFYKDQATHDAAPHDPMKPLTGVLTVTGTDFTTQGERSYSVSGDAYQYMRSQAMNAGETGFDIIQASYQVALATEDVTIPAEEGVDEEGNPLQPTKASFFAIPGHEAEVV